MNEILAKSKCIDEQRLYQMRGGGIDVHNANSILRESSFDVKPSPSIVMTMKTHTA